MSTKTPVKRPQGRPVVPEADRLRVGTIRLTQSQWDKLAALGGVEWLRKKIDKAKTVGASAKVPSEGKT